jgi:acetyl esterase/lipase
MNNLKVLKRALRHLAQQAGADEATDPDAPDLLQPGHALEALKSLKAQAGNQGPKAQKAHKAHKAQKAQNAQKAHKGLKGLKGQGAAGLLAAAALGTPAVGDAGPRAADVPVPPPAGVVEQSVVYKQTARGPLELHMYLPATPPPPGGRPCMVFFHGGSWRRGSSNQFRAFSAMLAQHGVVGMSAEYRLMDGDERQIPYEAMQDARSAMRYVRKYASKYGCDLGRIGAGGGSAGAHLAMMTAVKAPVDDPHDDLSVDPRPAALICFNGPTNFDAFEAPVPIEERRKYSPYYLVDRTFPPTLMLHGTHDKVIPYAQTVAFRDKVNAMGGNVKLVTFEGRGHGFFNKGKGQPGDWERSSNEMIAFLHGLGWM